MASYVSEDTDGVVGFSSAISHMSWMVTAMIYTKLRWFPLYGAAIDVLVFCASFLFYGGAHGPSGPMFVLHILNAPVASIGRRFLRDRATSSYDVSLVFVEIAANGALYGLVVATVVALRRTFRPPHST
jgi:hypothetical protein